jgi:hypothetical protein
MKQLWIILGDIIENNAVSEGGGGIYVLADTLINNHFPVKFNLTRILFVNNNKVSSFLPNPSSSTPDDIYIDGIISSSFNPNYDEFTQCITSTPECSFFVNSTYSPICSINKYLIGVV